VFEFFLDSDVFEISMYTGRTKMASYRNNCLHRLRELLSISRVGWDVMDIFSREKIQTKLLSGIVTSSLCVAMLLSLDLIDDVLIQDEQKGVATYT